MSFDSKTCYNAAFGGHLEVLKYLKSEGLALDGAISVTAAEGGHIDVLKYLNSEGVEFDEMAFLATAQGRQTLWKYLDSFDFEIDSP